VDDLNLAQARLAQQQSQLQTTEGQAQAALDQVASSRRAAQVTMNAQQATLRSLNSQIAQLVAQEKAAAEAAAYQAYLNRLAASHSGGNVPAAGGAGATVRAAESQIGVPYKWGAEEPGVGFDCSGLAQWSWRQGGVSIPRTANEQYHAVAWVSLSAMEPGDLVFWGSGGYADHVGIYVGNNTVVHAPSSGETVRYQQIWANGLLGAGRP
jgi:cell wall-associated NlpC family hydrolase